MQKYLREKLLPPHSMHCSNFSGRIYVEKTPDSVVSTTTTHREPRKIPDGTSTQVKAGIINKCAIKMA